MDAVIRRKLLDLAVLLEAWAQVVEKPDAWDFEYVMHQAALRMGESRLIAGARVWVDALSALTALEVRMLAGPGLHAREVTITLLADPDAPALRALRAEGNDSSVLVLTAKSDEDEKVLLLQIGADDYVTKPFGRRELGARIAALLRRAAPTRDGEAQRTLCVRDIVIDLKSRVVARGGAPIALSPKEYDLLVTLAQRAGTVVTRTELLRDVWRYEPGVVSRTVDLHVLELRRRLERDPAHPELIVTVRKVGYRMCALPASP
jgi:two-component system, OmpR family, response regulator MtrA